MEKRQLTQYKIITITAVLVVLACSFAIYLRLFTEKEDVCRRTWSNYNRNHHDDSATWPE